jgi:membrane protease YdiL (CAAX protease family)
LGISLLFPGVEYSATMEGLSKYGIERAALEKFFSFRVPPILLMLILTLLAGLTINTLFAFGEEIGWRGSLQKELSHLGFWKFSFLIRLIWGIWRSPLIIQGYNYPQHPSSGLE